MNPDGALGPDSFNAYFFQNNWDMVGHDVFWVVLQLFVQDWIIPNYNSNVVVLIPKISEPSKREHYRPIALANFKFKIITKFFVDRLAIIMPNIISPHQRGSIQGRYIGDCICLTSEAINML